MNKVRLIKIYELRGLIHPIEQYVIDLLDVIEEVPHQDKIDYKKKGFRFFTYYLNNNEIYLYGTFCSDFNPKFGCSIEERNDVLKYLFEKHLNLTISDIE